MILYLDTSAIVKKYFKEQGSMEVIRLWKKTNSIVTSTVAYAETLAAIHRKKGKRLILINPSSKQSA